MWSVSRFYFSLKMMHVPVSLWGKQLCLVQQWSCLFMIGRVFGEITTKQTISQTFEIVTCWSSVCKNFKHGDWPSFCGLILACLFWALSSVPHMDIFSQLLSLELFFALSGSAHSPFFCFETEGLPAALVDPLTWCCCVVLHRFLLQSC